MKGIGWLDNFNGPLDLLLYLIKQEEVEITDIPIKIICDKYLEYLRALEFLDVDVSSEFLVVAATLMLIKSRALLPVEEEIDLEEELNPEDELIQQLLEYKRYKVASRDLAEMAEMRARIFPFSPPRAEGEEREIELEEIDLWDLMNAFNSMLRETGLHRLPRLIREDKPLRLYIEEVFETVRRRGKVVFRELFEGAEERETIVGRFVALLELVRRGRLIVRQLGSYDTIELEIADSRDLSDEEIDLMEADLQNESAEMGADNDDDRESLGSVLDPDDALMTDSESDPARSDPTARITDNGGEADQALWMGD